MMPKDYPRGACLDRCRRCKRWSGQGLAAIGETECDEPVKDHPEVCQVPSVSLVGGRTRQVSHRSQSVDKTGDRLRAIDQVVG